MTDDEMTRLRTLLDKDEIRTVLVTYTRGRDRGDRELLSSVYHDGALDLHGSSSGPASGYPDWLLEHWEDRGHVATMHLIGETSFSFLEAGEVCHTETYVRANHIVERDGRHFIEMFFGRYLDRFERREGRWAIAQRVVVRDFMGDVDIRAQMRERPFQGTRYADDPSYAHLRGEVLDLP